MLDRKPFHEQLKYERELCSWSQENLAEKLGCDKKTVNRWESEGRLPHPKHRQRLCDLFRKNPEEFGLMDTNSNRRQKASPRKATKPPLPSVQPEQEENPRRPEQQNSVREDWREAPRLEYFYGRIQESAMLRQWIVDDRCRMVAVWGMGGVGKTAFTATLVEQVKHDFNYVFWRSLYNAPPLEHILKQCIQFFSDQRRASLPKGTDEQIQLLIDYLHNHRCLLVLDNFESVYLSGRQAGVYQEGYEGYGRLIQRIAESQHRSCLLLTSREKPREVGRLEGQTFL